MTQYDAITQIAPELQPYLANADHIDVKTITGDVTLREFLAGTFSYYPGWLKSLYAIRWGFVRLLGMKQEGLPQTVHLRAEDISMTPGDKATFFTIEAASEDLFWLASAKESHLAAYLGVAREDLGNGRSRFHVITIVHYRQWTGPIYFNVIRPFHHLVVAKMMQAGVAYQSPDLVGDYA